MAKSKPTTGMTTRRSSAQADARSGAVATRTQTRTNSSTTSPGPKATEKTKKPRASARGTKTRRLPTWKKVRVWWPPTRDKRKTDYGGAYWPAKVTDRLANGLRVEYDNGDTEVVEPENLSPATVPVGFGEEQVRLQVAGGQAGNTLCHTLLSRLKVGEYCEVFNGSKTDPAAWVARVQKVGRGNYTIEFPFHDSHDEVVKEERIRRARVYEEEDKSWKFINPVQEWEDGEVTSPMELELLSSMKELFDAIKMKTKQKPKPKIKAARKSATPWQPASKRSGDKATKNKQDKKRRVEEDPDQSAALASAPQPASISLPAQGPVPGSDPASLPQGQMLQSHMGMLMQQLGILLPPALGQDTQEAGRSSPKPKRKKDANAPKKPKSAYVVFMEKHRAILKESNPKLLAQEIMKKIGELWSTVSPEEKEECEKTAEDDRQRYKRELEEYVPAADATEKAVKKRRKSSKGQPKKPMSAYLLFSRDYRAKLERMTFSEATRKTAEAWHKLGEEEVRKYEQQAAVIKDQYEKDMKEFDAKVAQQEQELHYQQRTAILRSLSALTTPGLPLVDPGASGPSNQVPGALLAVTVREILGKLDLKKVRGTILRTFTQDAYYSLCDVWREGSERVGDAIRAFNSHILGRERKPDWRGFFVSIFGVEKMTSFLKQDNIKNDKTTPATSDVEDVKGNVAVVVCGASNDMATDPQVDNASAPEKCSPGKPSGEWVKPLNIQECDPGVNQQPMDGLAGNPHKGASQLI